MTSSIPTDIHYKLLARDRGRLSSLAEFPTPIRGHHARILDDIPNSCSIRQDGVLLVFRGFEWDFGSGPAIDTPAMVRASLAHDALCRLTNRRLVPWSVRKQADRYFRWCLIQYGCPRWLAWLRYVAVRSYSVTFGKHRDRERRKGLIT